MLEPTITQNSALYLMQHRPTQSYIKIKARRRRLVETINRLRDLRARTFGDVIGIVLSGRPIQGENPVLAMSGRKGTRITLLGLRR